MHPDVSRAVVGMPIILTLAFTNPMAARSDPQHGVSIVEGAALAPNVEAMPRLPGISAAQKRINARLALIDAKTLSQALACQPSPPDIGFELTTEVAFVSADFLSITRLMNAFCAGAAHGAYFIDGVTFDMETGEEVRWGRLFPPHLVADREPHSELGFVLATEDLTGLYLETAASLPAECERAIRTENDGWFKVWPSQSDLGLILMPTGLPHSNQACADPVVLPAEVLRNEGFAERLVDAFRQPDP